MLGHTRRSKAPVRRGADERVECWRWRRRKLSVRDSRGISDPSASLTPKRTTRVLIEQQHEWSADHHGLVLNGPIAP